MPGLVQSVHMAHAVSYNKNPVISLICSVNPSAGYITSVVMLTRCYCPCKFIYTCDLKFCRFARLLRSFIQCDLPPLLRRVSKYRGERVLYAETRSGEQICHYEYILNVYSDGLLLINPIKSELNTSEQRCLLIFFY